MKRQLFIVELVGPAGAGKTTLRNALSKSDRNVCIGETPNIRDIRNLPFLLWDMFSLLPIFMAFSCDNKQEPLTLHNMVKMAILSQWSRELKTVSSAKRILVVLDQGPVYMLSELLRHGPGNFRSIASKWWEHICKDWANILDLVICLDTSDHVLMERIHTRERRHIIKRNSDQWAVEFLARSRMAQSEVLSSIASKQGRVRVIHMDTSETSLGEIVQRICSFFS